MNQKKSIIFCLSLLLLWVINRESYSQKPKYYNEADIRQMLKKLPVAASVLYIAAHPDDENTQLIAYFANEKMYRTAYLSCTRGDGGQNLIGSDIGEKLGVIRTSELGEARKIDGGEQFFTRAIDFGYSKQPDETFTKWNREEILSDIVWIIRKFRPDVIITRFALDPGLTHGHHTASAILANEAFKIAGDPNKFSDQLQYVEPWKPTHIFWNTSTWFYQTRGQKMDTTGLIKIEVGEFSKILGLSYTELAANSRSMHKTQGFGETAIRGRDIEYLKQWNVPLVQKDIMEDVETSLKRINGTEKVLHFMNNAISQYNPENPTSILPHLIDAYKELENVSDVFWKNIKQKEIKTIITAITGLFYEIKTNTYSISHEDTIRISFEALNRSEANIVLTEASIPSLKEKIKVNQPLFYNTPYTKEKIYNFPATIPYTHPYWLKKEGTLGMSKVDEQLMRGRPENEHIVCTFLFSVNGLDIPLETNLVFKKNDPVKGEVYRPLAVTPPAFVSLKNKIYLFEDIEKPKKIEVTVIAGKKNIKGQVQLNVPSGWKVTPVSHPVELEEKYQEKIFSFTVTCPKNNTSGEMVAEVLTNGNLYNNAYIELQYPHIPVQTMVPICKAKVVKLDIKKTKKEEFTIGYIMGAGDEIPACLEQLGYKVEIIPGHALSQTNFHRYDAIILGIRAFNTVKELRFETKNLFEYVKKGGNLVVQYFTNNELLVKDISPYSLEIGRGRVSVEESPMIFLDPHNSLFQFPNKIKAEDFQGWVQERGLYFAKSWDKKFTPLLSSNDNGEDLQKGILLAAKYGEGHFIYTGLSFFRQLPAGVPGAYKLFVNIISFGKKK